MMTLALKRVQVYLKFVAIVAVVVTALVIILMNQNNVADIWFFRKYTQINVLWLMLVTSISSIVGWWLIRKVFAVVRDMKELRHQSQAEKALSAQRRMAQELAEREKRIDAKIGESIRQQPDSRPESGA